MSRCARTRHSQTAVVGVTGNGRTEAVGTRAVGIGRSVVPQCARADADAVAYGDRGGAAALAPVVIYAAESGGSQAPRQRVGDERLRRLMRMLSCAMDSSTAPSAALAAATRPSAVSAAIVEWGTVPQAPSATRPRAGRRSTCVGHAHRGQGVRRRSTGCAGATDRTWRVCVGQRY